MNLDALILSALRGAGLDSVSGTELAQRAGVSRAAVWARIRELRALGYVIEASPHAGYRLVSTPDVLHADDLLARLGRGGTLGRDVHVFRSTTSTNDVCERLARDGAREGVVVFAEHQTRGRGRLGRRWTSPAGKGLWFSVLLRPALRPQEATQLTIAAAVGLARGLEAHTGFRPAVKWPNDLLADGRKLGGILTEIHAELDHVRWAVLGIGLDVNLTPADFPIELRRLATSLRIVTGRTWDRGDLAAALLRELEAVYARVRRGGFAGVADEWEAFCTTLGHEVSVVQGARTIRGRAEALDDVGALLIRTQHGHLERVLGGDVTVQSGPDPT